MTVVIINEFVRLTLISGPHRDDSIWWKSDREHSGVLRNPCAPSCSAELTLGIVATDWVNCRRRRMKGPTTVKFNVRLKLGEISALSYSPLDEHFLLEEPCSYELAPETSMVHHAPGRRYRAMPRRRAFACHAAMTFSPKCNPTKRD